MTTRDPKQDLLPHVTFPIPDLKAIPKPGTLCREERLKTIIANLDQHHQATRSNIIEAGKQNLAQALESQHAKNTTNSEDADSDMDIDPPPPHTPPPDPAGMALMFANLNTPYHESMGDPVSTGRIPPDPSIKQSTPPLEIQHAKETLDNLALYDGIALPARQFYSDALDRLNGPTPSVDPRRMSSGSGSAFAKPSPWESTSRPGSSSRAVSGTFGASADPRLAGRSGSGSWTKQSPMQSPVERTTDPRLRR
ncbi:hypothetical protein Slin15195_G063380 [Septoria linicola]|uniref:Uncharacterized protein n=1 Tax=Septoria linicola TaxID=215465 RepID=A0A9Q9AR50_9PEZI|nr:hypothetical protein Slin14017_G113700 [Septoria linicola]USW53019.1 hypothetical protein Slin15195_G063380 [Septoria linicola]